MSSPRDAVLIVEPNDEPSGSDSASTATVSVPVEKIYRIGTLEYTRRAVFFLFFWLLWGDVCFVIFESLFIGVMPLYLKTLQASDIWISVIYGTLAGCVQLFFMPHISLMSDRFRSRLGRRVPFLLVSTPCTVFFMCLLGFGPEIGNWIHSHIRLPWTPDPTTVILTLMAIFAVLFHFFNMIMNSMFACIQRDTVPTELIPFGQSAFRIAALAGGLLFNWFVFPYSISQRHWVFVGVGILYTAVFMTMSWKVKEGEYPPPEPVVKRPWGILGTYWGYLMTCLSMPIYRYYIIAMVLVNLGGMAGGQFASLFQKESMGLSMEDIAKIQSSVLIAMVCGVLMAGFICSRIAPLKVVLFALLGMLAMNLSCYLLITSKTSLWAMLVMSTLPSAIWGIAVGTTNMLLYPKEKWGQFYSAAWIFSFGTSIVITMLAGIIMEASGHNYRLYFIFGATGNILAFVPLLVVYRLWKRMGGAQGYVAPVPA